MASGTWYLTVDPQQEPTDAGPAEDGRELYSVNFHTMKRPSATVLEELLGVLEDAGVGTIAVSLFGSSAVSIPTRGDPVAGPGPFLLLKETGGAGPVGTHNDGAAAYRRPGVQVLVTGESTAAVKAMAYAAYDALVAISNQFVQPRDLGASA
jgi:hypothetical protein